MPATACALSCHAAERRRNGSGPIAVVPLWNEVVCPPCMGIVSASKERLTDMGSFPGPELPAQERYWRRGPAVSLGDRRTLECDIAERCSTALDPNARLQARDALISSSN